MLRISANSTPVATTFLLSVSAAVLTLWSPWLSNLDSLRLLAVALVLSLLSLVIVIHAENIHQTYFALGGLVWLVLLLVEVAFVRHQELAVALEEGFSLAAKGEVVVWMVCVSILGMLTLHRPQYLTSLCSPFLRFFALFVLLCVLTSFFSVHRAYSLTWSLKLVVLLFSLAMWIHPVRAVDDLLTILRILLVGLLLVCVAPLVELLVQPSTSLAGGRLGDLFAATGVSSAGGAVFLMASILSLLSGGDRLRYRLAQLLGLILVVLGGGKAAMAATLVSGVIFFLASKNLKGAIRHLAGLGTVAVVVLVFDFPVVRYFRDYLGAGGLSMSVDSRLELWAAGLTRTLDAPILGHGFVTSKFVSLFVEGVWWPAGHLHNSFLDVLYNNGITGLSIIVLLNVLIIWKTVSIMRTGPTRKVRTLGAGLFALYVFLIINGLVTTSFGGRPTSSFMLFLAVGALSHRLSEIKGTLC